MTTTAIRTDPEGFPVVTCGRCSGSGTYPSSAWNGTCLECTGSGVTYPTLAVKRLVCQWRNEFHLMSRVSPAVRVTIDGDAVTRVPSPVSVGDRIRQGSDRYRTVAGVRAAARVVGSGAGGVGADLALHSMTLLTVITFDDDTTAEVYGNEWDRDYDRAAAAARKVELAGAAQASYRKYLEGAPARSATAEKAAERRAAKRAEAHAAREAEEAAQKATEAAAWAVTIAAHPELADLGTDRYAEARGFMADMRDKFLAGAMTEKQVAAAVEAVRRDRQRADDHAALVASGVTAPTGRVVITGTVTATWTKDTDFGVQYKMRVTSDEGWTVAGTVPRSLDGTLEEMRGRRVTLTATVEPSQADRTHGWYSRPAKATWRDVEAMAA